MKFGLIGFKVGMISIFNKKGVLIPITLIKIPFNYISFFYYNFKKIFLKTSCFYKKKLFNEKIFLNKFFKYKKYKNSFYKFFIINKFILNKFIKKSIIPLNIFYINQKINIKSNSLGKGFSGVIKKHNFKSGTASHGNSKSHRSHGSVGMCQDPGRVFLGKKMAGNLGNNNVSIKNLKIKNIDFNNNLIYLKGSIPGFNNCKVFLYYNF